jgi:hypothetical protein
VEAGVNGGEFICFLRDSGVEVMSLEGDGAYSESVVSILRK